MTSSRSGGFRWRGPVLGPPLLVKASFTSFICSPSNGRCRPLPPSTNPVYPHSQAVPSLFSLQQIRDWKAIPQSVWGWDPNWIGSKWMWQRGENGKGRWCDSFLPFRADGIRKSNIQSVYVQVGGLLVGKCHTTWLTRGQRLTSGSEVTSLECCDCSLLKRQCTPKM